MRRALVPLGLVVAAVTLGVVVFSPARSSAQVTATRAPVLSAAPLGASGQREGQTLFESNCSSCHGIHAQGSALAPNLHGVGAATVDLWVSSGWMPLANPTAQPQKKPSKFTRSQEKAIANYVASFGPTRGPEIPEVNLKGADVSKGFQLFTLNCAPCHTITGAGDALSNGLTAPGLHGVTPTQIAEAIETGPGNMPRFGAGVLDGEQATDVVAYVARHIEHPTNPGGLGLGGVGPVAEGFIGLFAGVGACLLIALWVGERTKPDSEDGPDGGPHSEVAHV